MAKKKKSQGAEVPDTNEGEEQVSKGPPPDAIEDGGQVSKGPPPDTIEDGGQVSKGPPPDTTDGGRQGSEGAPHTSEQLLEALPEDGGDVVFEGDVPRIVKREKTVEGTASQLAFILVVILGASIAIHYVAILVVLLTRDSSNNKTQIEVIERVFNTVLPAITGLVGTAVAYYFGRQPRRP